MKIFQTIARWIVGLVFMFSGFMKGVDPLGSEYKFHEYFEHFHLDWLGPIALFLGIVLCTLEFVIGYCLVTGVKFKMASMGVLIFMLFTGLTLYIALKSPVTDCGCFGDCFVISNWQTFYKNLILMSFVVIILSGRKNFKSPWSKAAEFFLFLSGFVIILFISIWSYRHLPLIDCMPWKKGTVISEKILPVPEKSEVFLIYKNKETGVTTDYTSKTLPWKDSVLMSKLEFVEQKKKVIQEFKPAPIHDFIITNDSSEDKTQQIIQNPGFQFLLVAHDITKTNQKVFDKINPFFESCQKDSISFVGLTGSSFAVAKPLLVSLNAKIPFYTVDETALKSVVRANPGLVLLKNGVVIDKWHYIDFPTYEEVKKSLLHH